MFASAKRGYAARSSISSSSWPEKNSREEFTQVSCPCSRKIMPRSNSNIGRLTRISVHSLLLPQFVRAPGLQINNIWPTEVLEIKDGGPRRPRERIEFTGPLSYLYFCEENGKIDAIKTIYFNLRFVACFKNKQSQSNFTVTVNSLNAETLGTAVKCLNNE